MAKHLAAAKSGSESEVVGRWRKAGVPASGLPHHRRKLESGTFEALRSAKEVLQTKAPQELDAYRSFVLDLVRSVSTAAGGGEDAETAAISKVEDALGR